MKLEDISAEIRPRNDWEAVDLGWVIARRHYGLILRAWMFTAVPLWVIILGLLHQELFWAMVLIWWLKPLYERVPLFIISRGLFGAPPALKEVLKAWPGMIFRRLPHALIGGRFSFHRTLVMPVGELESLRGKQYRRRAEVLSLRSGQTAFWSQAISTMVMHVTWISVLLMAYVLVPPELQSELNAFMRDLWVGAWTEMPVFFAWIWVLLYLTALTLVEPFHVGGGFGLYLNTRTRIEGWDIELSFRRLANRLKIAASSAAALVALAWLSMPGPAPAQDEPVPSKVIEEVIAHPDFEVHKETRYRYVDRSPPKPAKPKSSSPGWTFPSIPWLGLSGAGLSQIIFWMVIVLGVGFLLVMVAINLFNLRKRGSDPGGDLPVTKVVMGLNVEPESLPPDLVTVARGLWAEGKFQEAIGLMYRGAISWLIQTGRVPIQESDTEYDCVERTRLSSHQNIVGYFMNLTRAWLRTAYGETPPAEAEAQAIFNQWPFGSGRAAS